MLKFYIGLRSLKNCRYNDRRTWFGSSREEWQERLRWDGRISGTIIGLTRKLWDSTSKVNNISLTMICSSSQWLLVFWHVLYILLTKVRNLLSFMYRDWFFRVFHMESKWRNSLRMKLGWFWSRVWFGTT